MRAHYQKRLAMLQSKRKSSVQQTAISSDSQPRVVDLKKQEPKGKGFADKTGWDWLQFIIQLLGALAIPLVVLYISINFSRLQDASNQQQHRTDLQIAQDNRQNDLQIADDQQQEAILKGYLDDMSDLLLNHSLRNSNPTDEVRQVARARTLTTLRKLEAKRNQILLQFLQDAHLIGWKSSVVDLSNANLSGDDLRGVNLSFVDLNFEDLHGANLRGANLRGANLSFLPDPTGAPDYRRGANLNDANLSGADLRGANLHNADLHNADLSGADLMNEYGNASPHVDYRLESANTNLRGADLSHANLRGADLERTDLGGTDLSDADLSGATMSDGSKHS